MNDSKYLRVKQIVDSDEYPFNFSQLQNLLYKRKNNGLYKAIRKVGRRVIIRKDLFDEWIESYQEGKNESIGAIES